MDYIFSVVCIFRLQILARCIMYDDEPCTTLSRCLLVFVCVRLWCNQTTRIISAAYETRGGTEKQLTLKQLTAMVSNKRYTNFKRDSQKNGFPQYACCYCYCSNAAVVHLFGLFNVVLAYHMYAANCCWSYEFNAICQCSVDYISSRFFFLLRFHILFFSIVLNFYIP